MIYFIISLVKVLCNVLIMVVFVDVILSYFMSPFHTIRMTLDKIVEPLLSPIRKLVPPIQMIDFSPFILLIVIQLVESLVIGILRNFI